MNPIWGSDFFCVLLWLILNISLYFLYDTKIFVQQKRPLESSNEVWLLYVIELRPDPWEWQTV